MSKNDNQQNELYGICIDMSTGEIDIFQIAEPPKDHRFGMFISHRTGTLEQMESLKNSLIMNAFRNLKKVK